MPGDRTIKVMGVTAGRRGLRSHHLFSSQAPDVRSEPAETPEARSTVSQALRALKEHKTITWLRESGVDEVAVGRPLWEAHEQLRCRLSHQERQVSVQDRQGPWREGAVGPARGALRKRARVHTTLVATGGKQSHARKHPVEGEVAAGPIRVSAETGVRRPLAGKRVTREVWLVEVPIRGTHQEPWL